MGSSALLSESHGLICAISEDHGFILAVSGGSWVHLRCYRRVMGYSALLAEDHWFIRTVSEGRGFICTVSGLFKSGLLVKNIVVPSVFIQNSFSCGTAKRMIMYATSTKHCTRICNFEGLQWHLIPYKFF